ncbi:MAG: hypothetical protein RJA07_902 [Bacteroidota bacterium]|jgi:hypothetical protein
MKKIKISIGFSDYSDAELLVKAKHISQSMTGNSNFPSPSPTLTVYNAAVSAYETALGNAENGSVNDTAVKNDARDALETIMQSLGLYVQLNCANSLNKATSSGFDVHAAPTSAVVPAIPSNVKGDAGTHTGEVDAYCDSEPEADFFMLRYSLNITTPVWVVMLAQKSRKFTITGLTHGKDILISMCAGNTAGVSDWSDSTTVLVY